MTMIKYLRSMFKARCAKQNVEYVKTYDFDDSSTPSEMPSLGKEWLSEVDFSYQGDLEIYVRGLTIPREVIERWISAGLLFPDEMKKAEEMIKIMRRHEKGRTN